MKTLALVACLAFSSAQPGALHRECIVINDPVPAPQCLAVLDAFAVAKLAGKKPIMYLDVDGNGGRDRLGPVEDLYCEPDDQLEESQ